MCPIPWLRRYEGGDTAAPGADPSGLKYTSMDVGFPTRELAATGWGQEREDGTTRLAATFLGAVRRWAEWKGPTAALVGVSLPPPGEVMRGSPEGWLASLIEIWRPFAHTGSIKQQKKYNCNKKTNSYHRLQNYCNISSTYTHWWNHCNCLPRIHTVRRLKQPMHKSPYITQDRQGLGTPRPTYLSLP